MVSSHASLEDIVRARRSVRGFHRDRLVPQEEIREALALAQHAPSNCNVQPWRVYVAQGSACDRLREALCATIDAGTLPNPEDPVDTFPGDYKRLQVECAMNLYDAMGVARTDKPARFGALRRNFELFDAPQCAVVCMREGFGVGVALDIGIWLQTFMLALTERGIGSCAQASLRTYPTVVRDTLGIPSDLRILCGLSFGYEDTAVPANDSRQPREPIDANAVFITE